MSYAVTGLVPCVTGPRCCLGSIFGFFRPATRIKPRKTKIMKIILFIPPRISHLSHVAASDTQPEPTNMNNTNHATAIETLRAELTGIKLVSFENAKRLTETLNKASDEFILDLLTAKINIVSKLAINHASRRGLLN